MRQTKNPSLSWPFSTVAAIPASWLPSCAKENNRYIVRAAALGQRLLASQRNNRINPAACNADMSAVRRKTPRLSSVSPRHRPHLTLYVLHDIFLPWHGTSNTATRLLNGGELFRKTSKRM